MKTENEIASPPDGSAVHVADFGIQEVHPDGEMTAIPIQALSGDPCPSIAGTMMIFLSP